MLTSKVFYNIFEKIAAIEHTYQENSVLVTRLVDHQLLKTLLWELEQMQLQPTDCSHLHLHTTEGKCINKCMLLGHCENDTTIEF